MIKKNKFIDFILDIFGIEGITLYPFIFIRTDASDKIINHEKIHIEQYKELYVIGFLVLYIFDFMVGIFKFKNFSSSYYGIRFECEAYYYMDDLDYIKTRKKFFWKKYKLWGNE